MAEEEQKSSPAAEESKVDVEEVIEGKEREVRARGQRRYHQLMGNCLKDEI